jgi:hypothetical protein
MAYDFLACDRDQAFLLPPDVREWLPADHLAWFVLDVVDQLDLGPFLKAYRADGHGRAAYEPRMLLGVLLRRRCLATLDTLAQVAEWTPAAAQDPVQGPREGFASAHTWTYSKHSWWHLIPRPVDAAVPADGITPLVASIRPATCPPPTTPAAGPPPRWTTGPRRGPCVPTPGGLGWCCCPPLAATPTAHGGGLRARPGPGAGGALPA